jgi:hypothetical protein
MKKTSFSQKTWYPLMHFILFFMAGVCLYLYWQTLAVPVLFENQTLTQAILPLGFFLSLFFAILGFLSLHSLSQQMPFSDEHLQSSNQGINTFELYFTALSMVLSMTIFALIILLGLVDLNILSLA